MTTNDTLANALSAIGNADRVSLPSVTTRASSSVVRRVLDVLKAEEYIADYAAEDDGKSGVLTVSLKAAINSIGAIKPRFAVAADSFVKFEKRYLPAQGFGVLIVSTPAGIMTHEEAKRKNTGGKLLAYCY